jgi:hypothetical protein
MAQRRVSELSFNFDSLTDLVTNLAGALIMIVLLFFFLSSKGVKPAAIRAAEGQGYRQGRPTPGPPSGVSGLRAETVALEARLKGQREAVARVQAEIAEIDRQAAQRQPKEFADPAGAAGKPALVEFRPPMVRATTRGIGAYFVMLHDRVFFFGTTQVAEALKGLLSELGAALEANKDTSGLEKGVVKRLETGDFDLAFRLLDVQKANATTNVTYRATLRLKPDAKGESTAQALAVGSNYLLVLDGLNPAESVVDFTVYPDSFGLFYTLREPVLSRRLGYNWDPYVAGREISVSSSSGGTSLRSAQ